MTDPVTDRDILIELLIALEAMVERAGSSEREAAEAAIFKAKDHISKASEPTTEA